MVIATECWSKAWNVRKGYENKSKNFGKSFQGPESGWGTDDNVFFKFTRELTSKTIQKEIVTRSIF